jgi:outer membrane murein-binding lipoprotein Lpp
MANGKKTPVTKKKAAKKKAAKANDRIIKNTRKDGVVMEPEREVRNG